MSKKKAAPKRDAKPRYEAFDHPEAQSPMRPDVGTQAAFKKKKPPVTYRYDSSLSPALDWDGQNPAREQGEWLIATALEAARLEPPQEFTTPREFKDSRGRVVASARGLIDALDQLKRLGKPFLDWAGKAERWVAAVNADGTFGKWSYKVVKKMTDVPKVLSAAAK